EYIEESSINRRVTCLTWGKQLKNEKWDSQSTLLFYEGLNLWGTDFEMIAQMFPNRNRRNIRNKFNNEERKDPSNITLALRTKKPLGALILYQTNIDLEEYSRLAGTTFRSIVEIEADLEQLKTDFYSTRKENQKAAERLLQESKQSLPNEKKESSIQPDEEIVGQIDMNIYSST
ncbi:Transcription factor TFIIIB component B'', partial [Neolecta irregularis DAH-3]